MQGAARAVLYHPGVPILYWPYAVRFVAWVHNVTRQKTDGRFPWERRSNEESLTEAVPFGSAIEFIPNKDSGLDKPKMHTKTLPGIFLGWEMDVGDVPMKSGFVVAMSALKGLDLHSGKIVSGEGERLLRVERSKDIYPVQLDGASRFPLQKQAWKIRYFWEDPECDDGRFWGDPPDLDERVYGGDGEEEPRGSDDDEGTDEKGQRSEDEPNREAGSVD